jgi:hypothetical protein
MRGLHIIFVFLLVASAIWLLLRSFLFREGGDSAEPPVGAASCVLQVFRDGRPYYKLPLQKERYRIGAGKDCEIILKGSAMPQYVGEILLRQGNCTLINGDAVPVIIDHQRLGKGERILADRCEVVLGNYRLVIDKQDA